MAARRRTSTASRTMARRWSAVVVATLAFTAAACETSTSGDEVSGDVTVFAAASLTDAFTELAAAFEQAHPQVEVTFNFAGSSTLATQLLEGARADVFASANHTQMQPAEDAEVVNTPVQFAQNSLALAVESGNPHNLSGVDDLARNDLIVVLAAPEVPAGHAAATMIESANIEVAPASFEVDVRATLSRVELGEADVAVVYRSDLTHAADAVEGVAIADEVNQTVDYPIATVADAPNPAAANAWVDFVLDEGHVVFEAHGLAVLP